MVSTVSYIIFYSYSMHGQFAFCCDCQPSYKRNVALICVVIIFNCSKLVILFKNTHV